MDRPGQDIAEVYRQRRARVLEQLGARGALVLAAGPELTVGRDAEVPYTPDSELYYLTGYREPEAVLVLVPSHAQPFTLFVRDRDVARELWTGKRGGVEAAREVHGAEAHPITELAGQLPGLLAKVDVVYVRTGAGRADVDAAMERVTAVARTAHARHGHGPLTHKDPGLLLDEMRLIKDAHELERMRTAARITCESFNEALARVRPGVGEWEIEAAIEYGFRSRGADGPAFPTIAASGDNATVLHYTHNNRIANDGELLLIDAGARFEMYCADITRTVPVNGRFTSEQRALYGFVLSARDAAIREVRAGVPADVVHQAAQQVLAEGLIELGVVQGSVTEVIENGDGLKRYFPHRTSHWLGIDVHDVGAYATEAGPVTLQPGMVLTIEPGLYLADRSIGIRIEDDVLVTESGCEVLTAAVPSRAEDIEALLDSKGHLV